jgi:hypothetical protein
MYDLNRIPQGEPTDAAIVNHLIVLRRVAVDPCVTLSHVMKAVWARLLML